MDAPVGTRPDDEAWHERNMPARAPAHRRTRWVVVIVLAVLLALAVATTWLLRSAHNHLLAAAAHGRVAQQAVTADDLDQAATALTEAGEAFTTAQRRLANPVLAPLSVLPLAKDNLAVLRFAARSGARLADDAKVVLDLVREAPGGMRAYTPSDGRIPVERIATLAEPLRALAERAERSERVLAELLDAPLAARVESAGFELAERLGRLAVAGTRGAALAEALPDLLGADEPQRYLFGASNPAELRGSGGLVGAYAIVTAADGRLAFSDFQPIHGLENLAPDQVVPPNADFARRYDRYGGAGFWQNINMTPDFPSAGQAMRRLYERVTGQPVDGVILVDPVALRGIARLTGPVEVPGLGPVAAEDVVAAMSVEAVGEFDDHEERKATLGAVAAGVLQQFLRDGGVPSLAAVSKLGDDLGGGHLLIHAADDDLQARLVEADLAGALYRGDETYVGLVGVNAAANKVDAFTPRRLDVVVRLDDGGGAEVHSRLGLRNDAPTSGEPSHVIGPNVADLVAGEHALILQAYCGRTCEFREFERDGKPGLLQAEQELGHPVLWSYERLRSGEQRELAYRWRSRDAWSGGRRHARFRLVVSEQPALQPTPVHISVALPSGVVPISGTPGMRVEDDRVTWQRDLSGRAVFEVVFRPPGSLLRQAVEDWWARPVW